MRLKTVRIAVDIGGTFTDLIAVDDHGKISNVKVSTTPEDPSKGFLEAVDQFLSTGQTAPGSIRLIVHATTLASNALLTDHVPRTALITTKGFRDVLEIGRQNRPELYNLQVERPRPLVPRRFRYEVDERVAYTGKVLKALETEDVSRAAGLVRRSRAETVAICLLHSYANAEHEQKLERTLKRACPDTWITTSSDLLPEFREYERTSTTVVNACLRPVISSYLGKLGTKLSERGIRAPFYMMQSNGGTISSDQAIEQPARVIESGPVAGAVASRHYGKLSKAKNIISLDVGGTTSKAGVWTGNSFELTTEYEMGGRLHGIRRLEGSGYPVRFPQVDLVEVGTGGGSIARVDSENILHVGPESAGANPGPACYGIGGKEATVTDGHLMLGRLNPESLLNGQLRVRFGLAQKTVKERIADPLGMTVRKAALSILKIAVDNMSRALRSASIERGKDPRNMLLVAFGGAGPMHACEVAQQLGIRQVLVPPSAGLFSSLGLLIAGPFTDAVKTVMVEPEKASISALTSLFHEMQRQGRIRLAEQGVTTRNMIVESFFDIRYSGQAFELSVKLTSDRLDRRVLQRACQAFHRTHESRYGYMDIGSPLEIVNLRMICRGKPARIKMKPPRPFDKPKIKARRHVTFLPDMAHSNCPVYDRQSLRIGFSERGPAIIEDYDSTLVVPPGTGFHVDPHGSTIIRLD